MYTWHTTTYCMTCDRRVANNATKCPRCGVTFGPSCTHTASPEGSWTCSSHVPMCPDHAHHKPCPYCTNSTREIKG